MQERRGGRRGKDGDLRDVWREVQRGGSGSGEEGKEVPKGLIMTVLGKEEVDEHEVEGSSKEIGIMGQHFKSLGCTKIAIYLPNSMEYLMTLFGRSYALSDYHPRPWHYLC